MIITSRQMPKHVIIWEKWKDPYEEAQIEQEREGVEYDEDSGPIPVLMTPMGVIPITEQTRPGKVFNLWTGHTNFDITGNVAEIIEKVSGVESFNVFTRYRVRLGIGMAFCEKKVKQDIQQALRKFYGKKDSQSTELIS